MSPAGIAFAPNCPLPHRAATFTSTSFRPRPAARSRRRRRCICAASSPPDEAGPPDASNLTVGEALRRWTQARDAGITPTEPSAGAKRSISVLFVGRTNCRVSVAAQALFSDLVIRRRPSVQIVSHSAGTRVELDGAAPDPAFIEALRFKRSIDISSHTSCKLTVADLESADLVVCTDEQTRSQAMFMTADEGRINQDLEEKFVVITNYTSQDRLKSASLRDAKYSRDSLNLLISFLIDACAGLLSSLLEAPPPP